MTATSPSTGPEKTGLEKPGDDRPTESQLLADWAYRQLRRRILASELIPGTALSVPALARSLDISRSPTREAVQRLIHDGLATYAPRRGAEVASLDLAELQEIYAVKEPLSGLAARLAATRFTQTDVDALTTMLETQERAYRDQASATVFMSLDLEFHGYINRASGNATLNATMAQFDMKTNLAFPSGWTNDLYVRLSIDEHQVIGRALISGDADEADRATRAHLRNVSTRLTRIHRAVEEQRTLATE